MEKIYQQYTFDTKNSGIPCKFSKQHEPKNKGFKKEKKRKKKVRSTTDLFSQLIDWDGLQQSTVNSG